MYLFRENTSLRRWKPEHVAFMNFLFSIQIRSVYLKLVDKKRRYKLDPWLLHYGTGELPSHGRTRMVWDKDVDRLYTTINVNSNHWISLCINFLLRTIEVFDCASKKYSSIVEAFTVIVPQIVKVVQTLHDKKEMNLTQYSIVYAQMKPHLNKSQCHCGVYALKFIECHTLGLDLSLMSDENMLEARTKIAWDLLQATSNPFFIDQMSRYEPTRATSSKIEVIELN